MGERAWQELMVRREEIIRNEKADLFRYCWQPPIWRIVDALCGFPWVDRDYAERVRKALTFTRPIKSLLIMGGNRGSKSQKASHTTMRVLRTREAARGWALHTNLQMSRDYQQPLFYSYLPPALKEKDIKEKDTYIAYKQKTGFSEEKFVLPPARAGLPGSDLTFKSYDQNKQSVEGGNLDIIWPDELVPYDWVETMEFRVAEKNGWLLITFTPIEGYTETVRMFQDGAEVVQESVAFLCPKDGGPPDVPRALGLTPAEYAEAIAAANERRPSVAPQSVPEECEAWIDPSKAKSENGRTNPINAGQLPIPEGREFETVPRIMKCAPNAEGNVERAIVFFHTADNPYGNPKEVWGKMSGKPNDFIKERFYGIATKTLSARFVKFDRRVHVIAPDQVPVHGTNYLIVDPCGGRNFFMLWFRVTPEHVYVYREWPGGYGIPGIGVPGPWALPDGKKPDGRQGPAQKAFGWGLLEYKREIARLERWPCYWENATLKADRHLTADYEAGARKPVEHWDERDAIIADPNLNLAPAEHIEERLLDSRFASTPRIEKDRPVTLLTEFEDIGLFFKPTAGGGEHGEGINEGANMIDDALSYDPSKEVNYFNKPRLLISADCANLIYATTTWTGYTREGKRAMDGATKDPIDVLRYFFLSDLPYLGSAADQDDEEEEEGANQSY